MSDLFGPSHGWSTNVRVLLNTTFQRGNNCGFPILFYLKKNYGRIGKGFSTRLLIMAKIVLKFTVILWAPDQAYRLNTFLEIYRKTFIM